jgi:hypothetical protein
MAWSAGIVCIGLIAAGASLAEHSLLVTAGVLLGAAAVWFPGYWLLSRSCYYLSPTKAGFRDAFQTREVRFDEVQSVTISAGRFSNNLIFTCLGETVFIAVDPVDETWFTAVKAELQRRRIPIITTVAGFRIG